MTTKELHALEKKIARLIDEYYNLHNLPDDGDDENLDAAIEYAAECLGLNAEYVATLLD